MLSLISIFVTSQIQDRCNYYNILILLWMYIKPRNGHDELTLKLLQILEDYIYTGQWPNLQILTHSELFINLTLRNSASNFQMNSQGPTGVAFIQPAWLILEALGTDSRQPPRKHSSTIISCTLSMGHSLCLASGEIKGQEKDDHGSCFFGDQGQVVLRTHRKCGSL